MTETDRYPELVAKIDTLTTRVINAEDALGNALTSAADLQRENASLRETIAMASAPVSDAIMQLREWLRPWPADLDLTAVHVAMPGPMARQLLAELDRLTKQCDELRLTIVNEEEQILQGVDQRRVRLWLGDPMEWTVEGPSSWSPRTAALDSLYRRGLIEALPGDHRGYCTASLTDAGRAELDRLACKRDELLEQVGELTKS
jgi:hypothetical protein